MENIGAFSRLLPRKNNRLQAFTNNPELPEMLDGSSPLELTIIPQHHAVARARMWLDSRPYTTYLKVS